MDAFKGLLCEVRHALEEVLPDKLGSLVNEKDVEVGQKLDLVANLVDLSHWCR